jgi:hypothetical protein
MAGQAAILLPGRHATPARRRPFKGQEGEAEMARPRTRRCRPGMTTGEWPEAPWALLGACALAAPCAVLVQGGDAHTAVLAGLVCLGSPGAAIEAMLGLARLTSLGQGPGR